MAEPAKQQAAPLDLPITSAEFRDAVPVPPAPQLGRISDKSMQVQARHGWVIELRRDRPGLLCCTLKDHVIEIPLSNVKWIRRG
jgi:hypothetical protein